MGENFFGVAIFELFPSKNSQSKIEYPVIRTITGYSLCDRYTKDEPPTCRSGFNQL